MEFNIAVVRILLILLAFGVPIGIYVYRDAKRNGERRPMAWAVFSGLLVVAGLAVYVLHRDSAELD